MIGGLVAFINVHKRHHILPDYASNSKSFPIGRNDSKTRVHFHQSVTCQGRARSGQAYTSCSAIIDPSDNLPAQETDPTITP